MDTQHRQIFSLCAGIEDLAEAYSPDLSKAFHGAVIELMNNAEHHFLEEEFLYQELERQDLLQHKAEHKNYLNQLKLVEHEASLGIVDTSRIKNLGTKWWVDHLLNFDKPASA